MDTDARYVLRSSLRAGLGSPDQVHVLRLRPPGLPLTQREARMAACRSLLGERGYPGPALFRGSRTEPEAVGEQAEQLLQQNEQHADRIGYWWRYDVVWSAPGGSRVVAVEDYDGRELLFAAWGPGTEAVLAELEELLAPPSAGPAPAAAPSRRPWWRPAARPRPSH